MVLIGQDYILKQSNVPYKWPVYIIICLYKCILDLFQLKKMITLEINKAYLWQPEHLGMMAS